MSGRLGSCTKRSLVSKWLPVGTEMGRCEGGYSTTFRRLLQQLCRHPVYVQPGESFRATGRATRNEARKSREGSKAQDETVLTRHGLTGQGITSLVLLKAAARHTPDLDKGPFFGREATQFLVTGVLGSEIRQSAL